MTLWEQVDGLVQERRNSSALAMELCISCTNPPKWCIHASVIYANIGLGPNEHISVKFCLKFKF